MEKIQMPKRKMIEVGARRLDAVAKFVYDGTLYCDGCPVMGRCDQTAETPGGWWSPKTERGCKRNIKRWLTCPK